MNIDFAYSVLGLQRGASLLEVSKTLQQKLWSIPVELSQVDKNILQQNYKEAFAVIDEARTTQGVMSWLCTVLKKTENPKKKLTILPRI